MNRTDGKENKEVCIPGLMTAAEPVFTITELQNMEPFMCETRNAMYDIGFLNSDGIEDETEFTVDCETIEEAVEELEKLFADFCEENGFQNNQVTYVFYAGQDEDE